MQMFNAHYGPTTYIYMGCCLRKHNITVITLHSLEKSINNNE